MILVTGGTGLIGAHLLFYLTQNEENKIRAIYRSESSLKKVKEVFRRFSEEGEKYFLRIEWLKADINNISELEEAFRDVVYVFHSAGFISFQPSDFEKLIKVNVEGTANIVNLCIDFQVKKLCYVSSVAALSPLEGEAMNESSDWNSDQKNSDYAISKHGAEMEVWRGTQEGLKVVIVNPSIVLGSYFWNSGSGTLFDKVAKEISFFPTGGIGFVDVNDVVQAMLLLQFSDVENQRFVLNGSNQKYEYVLKKIAQNLGVKVPKRKVSYEVLKLLSLLDGILSFFRIKKRVLSSQSATSLSKVSIYDGSKIKQYIPFQYTDFEDSIERICKNYLSENKKN